MPSTPNHSQNTSASKLGLSDRLTLAFIGLGVIFASLGLGEAVYRLAFLDFDGATDRLPIEMMFGLVFALDDHQGRQEDLSAPHGCHRVSMDLIWARNHKIRHAVEAIAPVPYPAHQQAIRVIREEVDRIEWVLSDIRAR